MVVPFYAILLHFVSEWEGRRALKRSVRAHEFLLLQTRKKIFKRFDRLWVRQSRRL